MQLDTRAVIWGGGREGGREGGSQLRLCSPCRLFISIVVPCMEVHNLHGDIRGEGCNELGDMELQC